MKKLLFATMFVASVFNAGSSDAAQTNKPINWRTDYNSALAESKKTGKPVFINFHGEGCSLCAHFDRTTAKDPDFINESRNWVMLKVDSGETLSAARLAYKYQVTGFPTFVLVNSKGNVLDSASKIPTSTWKKWLAPKLSSAKKKFR